MSDLSAYKKKFNSCHDAICQELLTFRIEYVVISLSILREYQSHFNDAEAINYL